MYRITSFFQKGAWEKYALSSLTRAFTFCLLLFTIGLPQGYAQGGLVTIIIDDVAFKNEVESADPEEPMVAIYPNPATTVVHLSSSPGTEIEELEIVTTATGETMFESSVSPGNHYYAGLPPGIYVFRISFANSDPVIQQVVIQSGG